jgi:hypothetical protein
MRAEVGFVMLHLRLAIACLTLVCFSAGCLGSSFSISQDELARLASLPPEQRGQAVRVVQNFSSGDPDDPGVVVGVDPTVPFMVATSFAMHSSRGVGMRPPPRYGSDDSDSSSGSSGNEDSTEKAVLLLTLYAIASVGVGLVLAGSEGARYDGHISLNPNYPILLTGYDGGQLVVPFVDLTPELAAWAADADVMPYYDPSLRFLGRAPLDRVGFAYGMDFGFSDYAREGQGFSPGFRMQTSLGGYFTQWLGLHALFGFGFGEGTDLVDLRYGGELRFYPLAVSRLHLGLFANAGGSTLLTAIPGENDATSPFFGGGGLIELDLTTRLALTVRVGVESFTRADTMRPSFEGTVGLTVY